MGQAARSVCVIFGANRLSARRGRRPVCSDSGARLSCSRRFFARLRGSLSDPHGFPFGWLRRGCLFAIQPDLFSARHDSFATAAGLVGGLGEHRGHPACLAESHRFWNICARHSHAGTDGPHASPVYRRNACDNNSRAAAAPRMSMTGRG